MDTWTYWLIGAGLVLATLYLRHTRRAVSIQALATRSGFDYLGCCLPESLILKGTALDSATSTWNVIEGERNGVRISAFDCQIGAGKGSWRRTVIAAEASFDVFGEVRFNPDLTVQRSGDWVILYQPKTVSLIPVGLMPVAEIEAHINAIRKLMPSAGD